MELGIQVVNINGLQYTKPLVEDLLRQTYQFQLTIVDQGSIEPGTKEFLESLREIPYIDFELVQKSYNVDLNRLWNRFAQMSRCEFLCFLNNDVRVPPNFVEDTVRVFRENKSVGVVMHPTNCPDYQHFTAFKYEVLDERIVQGHDFTIRRECFTQIPDCLRVFGGDDWLFNKLYRMKWGAAMVTSAPIIHHHAKSHIYCPGSIRKEDSKALKILGIERLPYLSRFSRKSPHFSQLIEGDDYKRKGAWYERE